MSSLSNKRLFFMKSNKINSNSKTQNNSDKSNSLANFLLVYFDWTFFLCISPFRFVTDTNKKNFRPWRFYPQILITGILNLLWLNYAISTCRAVANGSGGTSQSTGGPSAYRYFLVLSFLSAFLFQGFVLKRFWFNKNDFLNILNFIKNEDLTSDWVTCNKWFIHLVCLLVSLFGLYEPILQLLPESLVYQSVTTSIVDVDTVKEARYAFYMINITQASETLKEEEITRLDRYLCVMHYLGRMQNYILSVFPSLLMLFGILAVWLTTKQFADEIRKEIDVTSYFYPLNVEHKKNKLTWPEIYKGYKVIRDFCEIVNEAYGLLISSYLGSGVIFHATGMDAVLVAPSITLKVRLLYIISLSAFTFVLAADVCEKMSAVKLWLAKDENRRTVPKDHLNIILGQLATRDVGIRGSNIFTITYPLLWSVITTVVTYFIICLQARK